MKKSKLKINPAVAAVFENYPQNIKLKMDNLRKLVLETAEGMEEVEELEETLKWGEPSYLSKYGSTIRIDWKERSPEQYAMYFKCTSKLVPTFKTVFKGQLTFEGNRAVILSIHKPLPKEELKRCIEVALKYHKVKHLPLLGL